MSINVSQYEHVTVLTTKEDLAGEAVDALRHKFDKCLEEGRCHLVVDCTAIDAIDSAGLEALLAAQHRCEDALGVVKLCGLDETCAKILEITRLNRRFEVFDNLESAVKSFR